jgi:hypothetical protein
VGQCAVWGSEAAAAATGAGVAGCRTGSERAAQAKQSRARQLIAVAAELGCRVTSSQMQWHADDTLCSSFGFKDMTLHC